MSAPKLKLVPPDPGAGPVAGPWYVAWKAEPGKMPYRSVGARANVWTDGPFLTYAEARALAAGDRFAGIGVVHSAAHDLVGVDVDACRDPATGTLTPWAQVIVAALDGVVVVTPSQTGVRVWLRAPKNATGRRKVVWSDPSWTAPAGVTKQPQVEVFLTGGFCTLPAEPIGAVPARPEALETLLATAPPPRARIVRADVEPRNTDLSIADLRALIEVRHPTRYHKLFIAGADPKDDDSKLDDELARYCAEVAGGDVARIEALMRLSAVARGDGKWKRKDYLAATIAHALATVKPEVATEAGAPIPTRTLGDLRANPDLLRVPAPLSAWLVWRGDLTLLVGREKLAGKTTLAASDARRAAAGGHDVLWLTAEESLNRVVKRFADLGVPDAGVVIPERWPRSWAEVEARIAALRPGAVYVDSLASFLMAVEGDVPKTSEGERWQSLVGRFKAWTAAGAGGVCVLLHATKENGAYRGSTGIGAAPDTIVTMRDVPDYATYRRLETIGRWGFPSKVVRFVSPTAGYEDVVNFDAAPATTGRKISAERKRIRDVLRNGMTAAAWMKAAGLEAKRSTFFGAVAWLRGEGYVTLDDETATYSRDEFTTGQDG